MKTTTDSYCEFCHKILSAEKLETEHGCLDCAGHIYKDADGYFCAHCIDAKNTTPNRLRFQKIINALDESGK